MTLTEIVKLLCGGVALLNAAAMAKATREENTDTVLMYGFFSVILVMMWLN